MLRDTRQLIEAAVSSSSCHRRHVRFCGHNKPDVRRSTPAINAPRMKAAHLRPRLSLPEVFDVCLFFKGACLRRKSDAAHSVCVTDLSCLASSRRQAEAPLYQSQLCLHRESLSTPTLSRALFPTPVSACFLCLFS